MKVAVIIALFAMLAVASAYYPANYYGGYGYPYAGLAGAYHGLGSYGWGNGWANGWGNGLANGWGNGWANGWGNVWGGYPYYYNQAAADKVDAAPVEAPVADSAVPAAQ